MSSREKLTDFFKIDKKIDTLCIGAGGLCHLKIHENFCMTVFHGHSSWITDEEYKQIINKIAMLEIDRIEIYLSMIEYKYCIERFQIFPIFKDIILNRPCHYKLTKCDLDAFIEFLINNSLKIQTLEICFVNHYYKLLETLQMRPWMIQTLILYSTVELWEPYNLKKCIVEPYNILANTNINYISCILNSYNCDDPRAYHQLEGKPGLKITIDSNDL